MLILLPFIVYLLMVAIGIGRARSDQLSALLLAEAVVGAAVAWGGIVAVSSEVLSLLHELQRGGVAATWVVAALGTGIYGWRHRDFQSAAVSLRATRVTLSKGETLLLGSMGLIAGALLLVAWISPPNNVDSLQYHVSRVAHWAQNQSLEHYATAQQTQLVMPIWAQTAILHFRVLWGGDQPSNLIQWFSMVLSMIGVAGVAARLGAPRKGQILAAAWALTIPAGILQASSTQNDYVVALWAVCTAFYVVTSKKRALTRLELLGLGVALGLGFLTKGTFYVYGPPLILWYFVPRLWTRGVRKVLVEGVALTLIAVSLNAGFWARNIQTYGAPYGPAERLQEYLWIRFLPTSGQQGSIDSAGVPVPASGDDTATHPEDRPGSTGIVSSVLAGLRSLIDRAARTAAFNLVTPSSWVNQIVRQVLELFPRSFPEGYLAEWDSVAWSHEDTTPNTLHLGLTLASIASVFFVGRRPGASWVRKYGLLVLAMFGLIPLVIAHGPSIFGLRYQLPFFVLAAPVVAATFGAGRRAAPVLLLGAGLAMAAVPWVLFNNTRPLIGHTPWPTRVGSILTTPAIDLMFAINPKIAPSYEQAVQIVQDRDCQAVGLRIDSGDLEYLFWWLFRAPESGIRIETVYTVPRLEPLLDQDFHPCAVLCTICGDRTRLHGLPRVADLDWVDVFAGDGFVWDPDG